MGKLLFIDVGVPASQQIVAAAATDVSAIIYDPATDTRATLLEKIAATGLQTISDVGFIQHGSASMSSYTFLSSVCAGKVYNIESEDATLSSWDELLEFYTYLHSIYGVSVIDFISCCIYDDPAWVYILNELEKRTGINFRASKNKTGSLVSGGDWIQESDGVDIRSVYFTEEIDNIEGLIFEDNIYFKSSTEVSVNFTTSPYIISAQRPVSGMYSSNETVQTLAAYVWGDTSGGGDLTAGGARVNGIQSVASTERAFACIRRDTFSNTVVTWGDSGYGGDCSGAINNLYNITHIASTQRAFAALRSDGRVFTWGSSVYGGDSTAVQAQLTNVVAIAATQSAFLALKSDKTVVAWGNPAEGGQLPTDVSCDKIAYIIPNGVAFTVIRDLSGSYDIYSFGDNANGGGKRKYGVQLTDYLTLIPTETAFALIPKDVSDESVFLSKFDSWGNAATGGSLLGALADSSLRQQAFNGPNAVITAASSSKRAFCIRVTNGGYHYMLACGNSSYGGTAYRSYDVYSYIYTYSLGFDFPSVGYKVWGSTDTGYFAHDESNIYGTESPGGLFDPMSGYRVLYTATITTTSKAYCMLYTTAIKQQFYSSITYNSENNSTFRIWGDATKGGVNPGTIPSQVIDIIGNSCAFLILYIDSSVSQFLGYTKESQIVATGSNTFIEANISFGQPQGSRWKRNGQELISYAYKNTVILQDVQKTIAGTYNYTILNSGPFTPDNSVSATLTVLDPPLIIVQPTAVYGISGEQAAFTVSATGDQLTYKWYKDNVLIPDVSGSTYTIASVDSTHIGSYKVNISSPVGSVDSIPVPLTIVDPPQITSITPNTFSTYGSPITLSVVVSGTPPFKYQWEYETTSITDASSSTYAFVLSESTRGRYRVKITSTLNNKVIYSNYISVGTPGVATILTQPVGSNVEPGAPYTLSVIVLSGTTPSYQWKKTVAGVETNVGTDQNTLVFSSFSLSDVGAYRVVITNADGSVSSTSVQLTYGIPPTIVTQPTSRTVVVAGSTTFSVDVSGTAPFTFQWKRNGEPVVGATSRIYTISPVIPDDAGAYTVDISNISGIKITSFTAALAVNGSLSKNLVSSGLIPVDRTVTFTENNVAYTGIKKTFTSSAPSVFTPANTNYPQISISSAATNITSVNMAITQPIQTDDGSTTVYLTMSLFNQNTRVSDVSNTPFTITLSNLKEVYLNTLNVYRTDTGQRTLVGTATRNLNGSYTLVLTHFSDYEILQGSVPCFVEGTRVATARGFVAVEDLKRGDRILTDDGRAVPFALARRVVEHTTIDSAPYLVPAGAFGPNMPPAPCRLSPTHAFQMAPGLWHFPELAARTNSAIRQYDVGRSCTYYHIKLPDYFKDNIVLEGGTVAESFGEDLKDLGFFFYYSEKYGGFVRVDPRTKKVRSQIAHI